MVSLPRKLSGLEYARKSSPSRRDGVIMYSRAVYKIVLACAKFRDGIDRGSYAIILSLRDESLLFTPFQALRVKLLSSVPPGQ